MPHIEKLYQRIKDRKDIQVITFNVDDNIGSLGSFLKENKCTFPVIPARFLMDRLVPVLGIPLNWIVDAGGVVRQESMGFGSGIEKWDDYVIGLLEKVSAGKLKPEEQKR